MLTTACRQLASWREAELSLPRVAVNVSARQFLQEDFTQTVTAVLAETGLPPASLELEVTESLLMVDEEGSHDTLSALKALGVQLAIDDFGTGYSSLNRLKHFPIDRLKIDRSFVRDLPGDQDAAAIANAIVAMADGIGVQVVAEGVETIEQANYLSERGCQEAQGYYFARPMPHEEITAFVLQRKDETGRAA